MNQASDPEFQRLRRLLALKRHEQPPPGYFDGFLAEFHRRQRLEPIRRASWWAQLIEYLRSEPLVGARYALAAAIVVLLVINAFLLWSQPPSAPSPLVAQNQPPTSLPEFQPMPPPSHFAFAENAPRPAASNLVPRYILDRVPSVSPASYDLSGDF